MQEHWYYPLIALMFVKLWRTFSFGAGFACAGLQNDPFSLAGCQPWLECYWSDEVYRLASVLSTDWQACLGWANHVTSGPALQEKRGMGQDSMCLLLMLCACQSRPFLLCSSISFLVLPAVPSCPVLLVPTMHDRQLILCLCSLTGFTLHTVCQWHAYFSNSVFIVFFPFSFRTMRS